MIEENAKNIRLVLQLYKKSIPLHRVFHSIRFKVNKDWDSAEPLFFLPISLTPRKTRINPNRSLGRLHYFFMTSCSLTLSMQVRQTCQIVKRQL